MKKKLTGTIGRNHQMQINNSDSVAAIFGEQRESGESAAARPKQACCIESAITVLSDFPS